MTRAVNLTKRTMHLPLKTTILGFSSFLLLIQNLFANPTGKITGLVPLPKSTAPTAAARKYFGKISGKVDDAPAPIAGVWLESAALSAPKESPLVTMGQKNYQFDHFLIIVAKGTRISFPNRDSDYHNIYSLSRTKRFDLGRYRKDEAPAPILFDQPGYVALQCEIHDHMKANVIVVDSPYFVTTDTAGRFTLTGIRPGAYTLHAQIDRKTKWQSPVTVSQNQTSTINFPEK